MGIDPITIGLAVSVIGLGVSVKGQREQRKAQKSARAASERASRAQERQQALEQQRERRKQIREARQLRARAVSAAVTQGAGLQSTVAAGTTGGLSSQLAANLGFLSQSTANVGAINTALGERSAALSEAATAGAVSNLGSTIFSNAEQISRIPETVETIFSPTQQTGQ